MLTVDRNGDVWVADVGRHQVLKFSPDGKLLLEVGAKLEPGPDSKHFCKPTQVAPLRDGGFIVSDGYCNARAARFDAAGKYVGSYSLGPEREEGGGGSFGPQIQVAHSVLADECGRRLYLADREGRRVLVFDLDSRKLTRAF
jgi:peptidylamidoglycolate lyase